MFLRLFLALCALPAFASTEDATVNQFRDDATAIPRALLAQGYSSFGDLDLKDLLAYMGRANVRAVDWLDHAEVNVGGEAFSRNSAQWKRASDGHAEIQVNRRLWQKTPKELRKVIGVHEHLGPLGLNDHDYQLSSALELLASPEASAMSSGEKTEFASKINVAARSGGGGIIGIGGGGDEDGADTKTMMLHRDLGRLAREKDPAQRREIMAAMQADLAIRSEVSRQDADDHGLVFRNAPVAVAAATRYAYACRQTLQLPSEQIEIIYQMLVKQNAELKNKLHDAAALKAWCQGFLDGKEP